MKESAFRRSVGCRIVTAGGVVRNIEDGANCGTPDMFYSLRGVCGWIEFKVVGGGWPKRVGGLVRVDVTLAQRRFLRLHGREGGGRCFLMILVGRVGLLIGWDQVDRVAEGMDKAALEDAALWVGGGGDGFIDRLVG